MRRGRAFLPVKRPRGRATRRSDGHRTVRCRGARRSGGEAQGGRVRRQMVAQHIGRDLVPGDPEQGGWSSLRAFSFSASRRHSRRIAPGLKPKPTPARNSSISGSTGGTKVRLNSLSWFIGNLVSMSKVSSLRSKVGPQRLTSNNRRRVAAIRLRHDAALQHRPASSCNHEFRLSRPRALNTGNTAAPSAAPPPARRSGARRPRAPRRSPGPPRSPGRRR